MFMVRTCLAANCFRTCLAANCFVLCKPGTCRQVRVPARQDPGPRQLLQCQRLRAVRCRPAPPIARPAARARAFAHGRGSLSVPSWWIESLPSCLCLCLVSGAGAGAGAGVRYGRDELGASIWDSPYLCSTCSTLRGVQHVDAPAPQLQLSKAGGAHMRTRPPAHTAAPHGGTSGGGRPRAGLRLRRRHPVISCAQSSRGPHSLASVRASPLPVPKRVQRTEALRPPRSLA